MTKIIVLLSALLVSVASAHGAMQKIVEGRYLLNLTSAPIAPVAGKEQQNLLAISDLSDNLIERNAFFDIEIRKNDVAVYQAHNLMATGGLLSFNYTFKD